MRIGRHLTGARHYASDVREAGLEDTGNGLRPSGEGWFVLNARDAEWREGDRRGAVCSFERDGEEWPQLGFNITVLEPGQAMAMYHREADQEGFLCVSGEALLLVEGEERTLRAWDYFHCPADVAHTILGTGDGPCVVVAVGARDRSVGPDWGAYVPDEVAARHGVAVDRETTDPDSAYEKIGRRAPARYAGRLPG